MKLKDIITEIIRHIFKNLIKIKEDKDEGESVAHIKQNDARLKAPIPELGCFFRSCLLIAEFKTKKSMTAEQINELWDWAKGTGRINQNDDIKDSASIATRALRVLGDSGRFIEVGLFKDGFSQFYPAFKNTEYARADALIQKVATGGKYGTHFRVVGKTGIVLEDPHEPPIKEKGVFYSILYAYEEG